MYGGSSNRLESYDYSENDSNPDAKSEKTSNSPWANGKVGKNLRTKRGYYHCCSSSRTQELQ